MGHKSFDPISEEAGAGGGVMIWFYRILIAWSMIAISTGIGALVRSQGTWRIQSACITGHLFLILINGYRLRQLNPTRVAGGEG